MVGPGFCADRREDHTKSNTHHEVDAARVGRFSLLFGWWGEVEAGFGGDGLADDVVGIRLEMGVDDVGAGELEAVEKDAGVGMLDEVLGEGGNDQRKSHLDRRGIFKGWEAEIGGAEVWRFRTDFGECARIFVGFGRDPEGWKGQFALFAVAAMETIVEETQRLMDKRW